MCFSLTPHSPIGILHAMLLLIHSIALIDLIISLPSSLPTTIIDQVIVWNCLSHCIPVAYTSPTLLIKSNYFIMLFMLCSIDSNWFGDDWLLP
jgi:hypothetical protein